MNHYKTLQKATIVPCVMRTQQSTCQDATNCELTFNVSWCILSYERIKTYLIWKYKRNIKVSCPEETRLLMYHVHKLGIGAFSLIFKNATRYSFSYVYKIQNVSLHALMNLENCRRNKEIRIQLRFRYYTHPFWKKNGK